MALLEMHDLKTFFTTKRGVVKAVNGVSYKVEAGRTLGVVGESGSGKSVSAMSMLQLLDGNGYIAGGSIMFDGKDLTKMPLSEMQKIRGNAISVIFQEPMTSLNPVFTIERQVSEPFIIHQGLMVSIPRLDTPAGVRLESILGSVPHPLNLPKGCKFAPRCKYCQQRCLEEEPELVNVTEEQQVRCFYPRKEERRANLK